MNNLTARLELRAVADLFFLCRPSAILGRIMAVVIDPIDAVFSGRPKSHVGQESTEVLHPSVADRDATAAINRIPQCVRIQATRVHSFPDAIFRGASRAVLTNRGWKILAALTAAALRVPSKKVSRLDDALCPAGATGTYQPRIDNRQHCIAAECLSNHARALLESVVGCFAASHLSNCSQSVGRRSGVSTAYFQFRAGRKCSSDFWAGPRGHGSHVISGGASHSTFYQKVAGEPL